MYNAIVDAVVVVVDWCRCIHSTHRTNNNEAADRTFCMQKKIRNAKKSAQHDHESYVCGAASWKFVLA